MTLIEYEVLIKRKVAQDVNDPEIYINLQKMVEIFLRRKKVCRCSQDYSDMSHTIAGDIYLKLIKKEVEINYFLGYLEKVYKKYAHEYYNTLTEMFTLDPTVDTRQPIYGNPSSYEYNVINNRIYLEEIKYVIDEVMMQSCKYDPETSAYANLELSLILSILRNRITYFHLNKEQEFYLKIILTNFYSKVVNQGLGFDDNKNTRY